MRFRNLAAGLALLTTGTVVGVTTQQFASADVSSGDRPVLVPIESCRLVDTRENPAFNVGPRTTPLGPAETYQIDSQEPGTECTGDIPTAASALAINLTALNASADGFITVWAQGDRPNGSTLNPQPGQLVFNAATVDLAADDSFLVYNERGTTDIIIDVIGYYENHDHDDRYYTQIEVDGLLAPQPVTQSISIPAHGLNVSEAFTIITRDAGGLNWENNVSNSAALYVQRPMSWTGSGTVTYRILYFRTSTTAGDVQFFARPDSVDAGDSLFDASSILSSVDTDVWNGAGFGGFREVTIDIPSARLDADWWKITLQRNSGFAGDYPDDVVVTSVALEYEGEY